MAELTAESQDTRALLRGIGWMLLTGFCFVGVTGIVRYLGSDMPAIEAAFIRYAAGTVMIAPMLVRTCRAGMSRDTARLFALRGLVHGGGVMLWFYAMARIPIAEVTAIGYSSPIYVTILAALFLGERMHLRRIAAVMAAFVGVLLILRPGISEISNGHLAQLGAAPLFAVSYILAKQLSGRADPSAIVAMLSIGCTIVLLPGAIAQWRQPTWEEIGWLTLTAAVATTGHYTMTAGLSRRADHRHAAGHLPATGLGRAARHRAVRRTGQSVRDPRRRGHYRVGDLHLAPRIRRREAADHAGPDRYEGVIGILLRPANGERKSSMITRLRSVRRFRSARARSIRTGRGNCPRRSRCRPSSG